MRALLPADQSSLLEILSLLSPKHRFELSSPRPAHWFQWLSESDLGGFVLDTDTACDETLTSLEAAHEYRPSLQSLLLVGKRGLVGHENLLLLPGVCLLPKPWTPSALKRFMQAQTESSSELRADDSLFLASLVEDLRDSLSASTGYLQLSLDVKEEQQTRLLQTAIEASRRLDERLNALMLASGSQGAHPTDIDLSQVFPDSLKEKVTVFADPKVLAATSLVAISWLERFGTGGSPALELHQTESSVTLNWMLQIGAQLPDNPVTPPPFLRILLGKLAERVPAQLKLSYAAGVIPTAVALIWNRSLSNADAD